MILVHGLRIQRCNVARRTACQTDLRQPKVQNLGMSALGDKDVRGLDVAADDAFCMGCVERIRDLDGEGQDQFRLHRTSRYAMLQRQPIEKLHSDEGLSLLVINLVDRADVRMIQCRGSFGFALKTGECLRVFGYVVGQELEGNKATEFNILSFVDHSHTAAAQFFDDAVMRDDPLDHEWARDSGCNIREATRQKSTRTAYRRTHEANPVISGSPKPYLHGGQKGFESLKISS